MRSFRRFLERSPWYIAAGFFFVAFGGANLIRGYPLPWAILSGLVFSAFMTPFYAFYLRRQKKAREDGDTPH